VISPLLANIYLHYVIDLWAERWRRREATGDMIIVRYADDIIVGFEHETDARRFSDGRDIGERLPVAVADDEAGVVHLVERQRRWQAVWGWHRDALHFV
jgi:hypothetical protein